MQKSIQFITRESYINFGELPKYDEWINWRLNEFSKT